MPSKHHSRAQKLAAVLLARESGVEAAVAEFGIGKRTAQRWLQSVELPEDQWEAIEATLLARLADATARDDHRRMRALSMPAGVSSRNATFRRREIRAAKLRAERTDKRVQSEDDAAAEQAQRAAVQAAIDHTGPERVRLLRDWLDARADGGAPDDDGPALDIFDMLAYFAALTDDEAAAVRAEVDEWQAAQDARWRETVAQLMGADSDRRLLDEAAHVAALLETTDA